MQPEWPARHASDAQPIDGAWWSFAGDQSKATAGFFAAFTRAKQRVVFTYCAARGTRSGIAALYNLLMSAGVGIKQMG
jgi:hypothetical protein